MCAASAWAKSRRSGRDARSLALSFSFSFSGIWQSKHALGCSLACLLACSLARLHEGGTCMLHRVSRPWIRSKAWGTSDVEHTEASTDKNTHTPKRRSEGKDSLHFIPPWRGRKETEDRKRKLDARARSASDCATDGGARPGTLGNRRHQAQTTASTSPPSRSRTMHGGATRKVEKHADQQRGSETSRWTNLCRRRRWRRRQHLPPDVVIVGAQVDLNSLTESERGQDVHPSQDEMKVRLEGTGLT